jgi:hypothetical protein
MKILKIVLFIIIGFVTIVLLVAAFTKKEYAIEREIVIAKPKEEVFHYLKYLKNQQDFNVWTQMDPTMKKEYKGTDGTVGAVYSWNSKDKNVGRGEQEIVGIKEGEKIDFELRFFEPFEAKDHAYFATEQVENNQTKVKWGFDGKMKYPMNILLLFMDMDKMLGDQLMQGLKNLKTNLEK